MSNIVLKLCRETNGYASSRVAKALGVAVKQYKEIEAGEQLMTHEQAEKLGKLYEMRPEYFFTSALQLDSLLVRKEVIRILKWKNEQLESQLKNKVKRKVGKAVKQKTIANAPV